METWVGTFESSPEIEDGIPVASFIGSGINGN
jgi:hypothetical protein